MPIFFGPNFSKFPEAVELINRNGAITISTSEEFEKAFEKITKSAIEAEKYATICKTYVMENVGSTQKIIMSL